MKDRINMSVKGSERATPNTGNMGKEWCAWPRLRAMCSKGCGNVE